MIKSVIALIGFVFFTTFWGLVGLFLTLISNNRYVIKYAVRPWGKTSLWSAGIKLDVKGLENIPPGPCIIMYNHQSSYDILAFSAALPIEWKAMMKKEVLNMPFVGWVSKLSGHYFVARDGSSEDMQKVKEIVKNIKEGPSVLVAPEGTRSEDGKLLPFKKGGFLISLLAGVPVVPMIIWGGKDIKTKKSGLRINTDKPIKIRIMPPIDVKSLPRGKKGREQLEHMVRDQMENEIVNILNEV
ncbi:MAG: hypothetical protein GTO02_16365 [Candidatus Dadabacteria bacterium]|nr:hypothetical protein [Candidatus Dadabacteria bacterium]NIQ15903.1 hypothetical protein [Candidatus Dadabacteria bacterium]